MAGLSPYFLFFANTPLLPLLSLAHVEVELYSLEDHALVKLLVSSYVDGTNQLSLWVLLNSANASQIVGVPSVD